MTCGLAALSERASGCPADYFEEVNALLEVQVCLLAGHTARAPWVRRSALLAQLVVLRAAQDGLHDAGPEEAVADPARRLLAGCGREGRAR